MGTAVRVAVKPSHTTAQQDSGAALVAAERVRQADSDLSQALPEVAVGVWRGLPGRLEHLVGVKWPPGIQQSLRLG